MQHHLARGDRPDDGQKRLYVIDESSMASTKQMHTFVERLKENDRVLFVGDTRQHEAWRRGGLTRSCRRRGFVRRVLTRSSGRKTLR